MTMLVFLLGLWVGVSLGLLVGAAWVSWQMDRRAARRRRLPLSLRALGPHDMPRIHAALSPHGLEAATFTADELDAWEIDHADLFPSRRPRVVEYAPVRVRRPA